MLKIYLSIIICFFYVGNVHADYPFTDSRQLMLAKNNTELGNFKYGHLIECLTNASFPDDPGPRKLTLNIPRLVVATIENYEWAIRIRESDRTVIIESIDLNTTHYYLMKDKRRLLLRLFGHCDLKKPNEATD